MQALAIFAEVVKRGAMTAAAKTTGISQPAISAQVRALERYFGMQLIQRDGRGSAPTEAGRLVADYAARVLALVDELGRGIADLEGLEAGELVVGASSTAGEHLLPGYLGRFHAAHPRVRLTLRIGNSAEITRMVAERGLDLAIVGDRPADHDLSSELVFDDEIVVFVAPGDRLLNAPALTPLELCGRQFVMRETGSATRANAERCLWETSCGPGHVIALGSNEAVKRAVEAGLGIGMLSRYSVEAEQREGRLVELPLREWNCRRSFWIIRRQDRALTRAESAFLALLPHA